jgi:enamine deaminase RidA (YjgF/YER057c/UK114 family)
MGGPEQEAKMSDVEARLKAIGLTLPVPAAPVANYVPSTLSGKLLFVSGQLPFGPDGKIADAHTGKVGGAVAPDAAQEAARLCAINALAQAKAALGALGRLSRCLRLTGYVAAAPGFVAIPAVVNGASDFMGEAMGEAGRHARSAVGVAVLPLDSPVELELVVEFA